MRFVNPFVSQFNQEDLKQYQLQLFHQSARTFVLENLVSNWIFIDDEAISPASDDNILLLYTELLEGELLKTCLKYLSLDDFGRIGLFSETQILFQEQHQMDYCYDDYQEEDKDHDYNPSCTFEDVEKDMDKFDPVERGFGELFVYASCYWPRHLGAVTVAEYLPDLDDVERACQKGSLRLENWMKQFCRPKCTFLARFNIDSTRHDPLIITAVFGSEAALQNMLQKSDFGNGNFLEKDLARFVTEDILQYGTVSRLAIVFLDSRLGYQLRNIEFFRLVLVEWTRKKNSQNWELVFDLVHEVTEVMIREQWGNEFLCMAAISGCMPIVHRLTNTAQHNEGLRRELLRSATRDSEHFIFTSIYDDSPKHQSIGEAVWKNHVDVVQYLLKQDGIEEHLRHRNSKSENVLYIASKNCNPVIYRLLVPRFEEGIWHLNKEGETPLISMMCSSCPSSDRIESARILLNATPRDTDERGRSPNPLRVAVDRGDYEMRDFLVKTGGFETTVGSEAQR